MSRREQLFAAALQGDVAFVDDHGIELTPPTREPDEPEWKWLRRVWDWKDSVTNRANAAFDEQFRKSIKS